MSIIIMETPKHVIPAKAGIQKLLALLDSRVGGSDERGIIRGCLIFIDLLHHLE